MFGSPEARALHARYPAVDLHADSLMWSRWTGYDILARHDPPLPFAALGGHVDRVRPLDEILARERHRVAAWDALNPWPLDGADPRAP